MVLLLVSISSAFAAVTYSVQAPASATAGANIPITVSANTNGATVAGMSFTLTATGPFTFDAPSRGAFASATAFPTFNCNRINTNTKVVCSISGTSGVTGGSGIVANLPGIATGSFTLALSNLGSQDDLGDSISSQGPAAVTSVTVGVCNPTCPLANTICQGTTDTSTDGCGGSCNVAGTKAEGTCASAAFCTANAWVCEGQTQKKQCNAAGTGYNAAVNCAAGETCSGEGICHSGRTKEQLRTDMKAKVDQIVNNLPDDAAVPQNKDSSTFLQFISNWARSIKELFTSG